MSDAQAHFMNTSGETDPVWVHLMPYSRYPRFPALDRDISADVCVIGSGVAGISIAYELITRGKKVAMIEARNIISGESGRTSGHLTNALDDGYPNIKKKHGYERAKLAAESHTYAIDRVAHISRILALDCEFRYLPAYKISKYPRGEKKHKRDAEKLKEEADLARELGLDTYYREDLAIQGWDGAVDQRDAAVFSAQATFHPTKYLLGVLNWLETHPNFQCFANTRAMSIADKKDAVTISTEDGHTITAQDAVEATCIPLQKLSIIAEMAYFRTYCIAVRVPKGSVEDCLIYDSEDPYKYVRLTRCDEKDDYLVIGGCDHKVGQEDTKGRFAELETWVRERFTNAGSVDYRWSGQIMEPVDYMGFIGKNQGMRHTYVVTGDSGDGLTHGVLAGRLIADEIEGRDNAWAALYNPSRLTSVAKSLPSMLKHDLQINAQYKRYLKSDVKDIEDIAGGTGGVIHEGGAKPVAVYKDEMGHEHRFSAMCPHMKGVVCWNDTEKSWDCPVHGSRFSYDGVCIDGPAKSSLSPMDELARERQQVQQAH